MVQTEQAQVIDVKIIMPFGGSDDEKQRKAALTFKVIQAIVNKYGDKNQLSFDVAVCRKYSGEIGDPILEEIATAEVVVAVLENSATVTYELAFRHILRGQMIVVLEDGGQRPKYIDDWAYVKFSSKMREKIAKEASDTENFPEISFDKGEISPGIRDAIDRSLETYTQFSLAMNQVLKQQPKPSRFFEDVVLKLQHKDTEAAVNGEDFGLGGWAQASYYPLSVIKIDWNGIHNPERGRYELEDMVGQPTIFDGNWSFIKLYQLPAQEGEEAREVIQRLNRHGRGLGASILIENLATTADPKWDKAAFEKDQTRLTENVIFQDEMASSLFAPSLAPEDRYARVPIIVGNSHPVAAMRGKSFLPCLLARRHEGKFPLGKHSTYILVAYIDVTGVDQMPTSAGAPVAGFLNGNRGDNEG